MSKFNFIETKLKDLYIIEPTIFGDSRGYFMETYNKREFLEAGLDMEFVQENESKSKKGVLRGLHFQTENVQGKLVRVAFGEVYDVAVDLRIGSPTYGLWEGVILSSENKRQFYVPEGFAHGFLVLSNEAVFNYMCTNYYNVDYEGGILWNDKDINIEWPLDKVDSVILSEKDKKLLKLSELDLQFKYGGE
ncbi:dTDP-4-dehydrorhamnose 3,5-epimerase [Clostridioides difficile]|uniref:dTDP-4-dehydrorhamnose 3,5-epimerase n=1 Tax=Clostridioides difficile TaxID=1496 RepID=UPI0008241D12|nr:dTDP-4-dehydrorhamnose 3,5-epimerase [Clostridioides difficile]MDO0134274.1 dTDP-4-dehydrorhamnose 3,5-epimerase [Clostridioides difficile]MDX5649619.1 dTDP-4-dehydrorhamnose 3,5-epimerase [Clostridioides difficile]MEC5403541.1 dTDP-4-dehydrorhamnose 3,5-epimerase [Clostridioides difficile]TLE40856.1 dTDP-4-dehydrorhamnose 3,5-epimerase [Clostridioides difficile]HBE9334880.1 dTDP-4-dehydrorhamnose 3,5-epimerase [Clostridioides difficile]